MGVRTSSAAEDVAQLHDLGLQGLRDLWRERYGPPPTFRSADLLRHMLAWRIQAEAEGGLDREVARALKRAPDAPSRRRLAAGARIAREHRGVVHEVEVLDSGYRYGGRVHASLSTIAREITGTRWNGWRFFGLAEDRP